MSRRVATPLPSPLLLLFGQVWALCGGGRVQKGEKKKKEAEEKEKSGPFVASDVLLIL